MKSQELKKEQIELLKELLHEERLFLMQLVDRVEHGLYDDIPELKEKVKETNLMNSSLCYHIVYNHITSFQDDDLYYIKSMVKMRYEMQCLYIEKFKNQIWWSEGRPQDATSESLEMGVPEEDLNKRDRLKNLLDLLNT